MKLFTDQAYLKTEQYRDSSNLDARIALHRQFSTNPEDFHRWYFDRLAIPEQARVLELGCGSAAFWQANGDRIPHGWEVTLTDVSPGMLASARQQLPSVAHPFSYLEADIQGIPFPDDRFDVVMANHMLYHVPDRPKAYAEIRRVLRRGGRFYAATNGRAHMRELRELFRSVGSTTAIELETGFSLEGGAEELAGLFEHIELYRYESDLVVTESDPLKAFFRSIGIHYEVSGDRLTAVEQKVDEAIARDGSIFIQKSTGFFECR